MTVYDLQGTFYEACDCEVICPCWVGMPPDMGSCTGIFAWDIEKGTVGNPKIDVSGSKVIVMSSGKSCDISKYMIVLIQSTHKTEIENAFKDPGAWKDVFQVQSPSATTQPYVQEVQKINIDKIGTNINISVENIDPKFITKAQLKFTAKPVQMIGQNAGDSIKDQLLIDRVVGNDPISNKSVSVGFVDTPIDEKNNGLNLLADIPGVYTFDLDISRVTAMRGNFHYTN
jgi:Protein of unknown function (DUF1326)